MGRRENPVQAFDRFTLEQAIGIMQRLGEAAPEYVLGYEHGFKNAPFAPPSWDTDSGPYVAYKRGRKAGRDAYHRGAHDEPLNAARSSLERENGEGR